MGLRNQGESFTRFNITNIIVHSAKFIFLDFGEICYPTLKAETSEH